MNLENDRDYLDYCRVKAGMEPVVGWTEHIKRVAGKKSYHAMAVTEWSKEFESAMRARLLVGGLRYNLFEEMKHMKKDYLPSMRKRLEAYAQTGNTELLVDIANFAMCIFVQSGGIQNASPLPDPFMNYVRVQYEDPQDLDGYNEIYGPPSELSK